MFYRMSTSMSFFYRHAVLFIKKNLRRASRWPHNKYDQIHEKTSLMEKLYIFRLVQNVVSDS